MAGGFKAIIQLIEKNPANIPAAIFVIMHLGKQSIPEIIEQLEKKLPNLFAVYRLMAKKAGHLYVAPKNWHMLLTRCYPHYQWSHENRWRSSIDVLFRSAKMVILLWIIRCKRKYVQMTVPLLFRFVPLLAERNTPF